MAHDSCHKQLYLHRFQLAFVLLSNYHQPLGIRILHISYWLMYTLGSHCGYAMRKAQRHKSKECRQQQDYLSFYSFEKPHLTPQQQVFVNSSRKVATSLLSGNNPLQPNPAAKGPIPTARLIEVSLYKCHTIVCVLTLHFFPFISLSFV